jgi:putative membrane protein
MSNLLAVWMGGRGFRPWDYDVGFRLMAVLMFFGFLALLIVGVVLLWQRNGRSGPGPRSDEALATLRMRYARGEMTREEFLQANADLGDGEPPLPE